MAIPVDPRAKGLIFDLDGTLADNMPLHHVAWTKAGEKFGFEYSSEHFYHNAGMATGKIVHWLNERYGLTLKPDEVMAEKERQFMKVMGGSQPIRETVEIVNRYHGKLPMAVGTGSRSHMAEIILKAIGLEEKLEIVVCSDHVDKHKPEPDTFLKCAELMGVEPALCQVFEDGNMGIIAAERAGMMVTDIKPYLK